jgi:hypothetical protein
VIRTHLLVKCVSSIATPRSPTTCRRYPAPAD